MHSQSLFLPSIFLITALIVAGVAIFILIRFQTMLACWGAIFMLAVGGDLLSYSQLMTGTSAGSGQLAFHILVITYVFLKMFWLFFTFAFCGYRHWINWKNALWVGVIYLFVGGAVLTYPEMDSLWVGQGQGITFRISFGWMTYGKI